MSSIVHKSSSRGLSTAPWLVSRHSFSFNTWYDPNRMQFGALRVLNDDLIAAGGGFPPHPHQDMEIITIPLRGAVAHEDSSGGKGVVQAGQIQIMSAGSGVVHSEYNASDSEPLELLQVWILPNASGLPPRYAEQEVGQPVAGQWQVIVAPEAGPDWLHIFQRAWVSQIYLTAGSSAEYAVHHPDNRAYVFVVSGEVESGDFVLQKRDALAVLDELQIPLHANQDAHIFVFDVPM